MGAEAKSEQQQQQREPTVVVDDEVEDGDDGLLELWNGGTIGPDFNDDDPMFMTDKFRMYCYKVLPCSKRFCHDWSTCPFAHFSERAKRRDPRTAKYTAIACPEMKKQGEPCPRGDKCPYSHNTFEYWLHPTRYRTRVCRDGEGCTRKVCFFAHKAEDVRVPPCRPSLPVADDPWPASDDSGDAGFDAPFGAEPAGKAPGQHRRVSSAPNDANRGLSGRLSDMLKQKIPTRQQSNGFHQPSSQDLGSTFFEKVLESIKDGSMSSGGSSPSTQAPPMPEASAQDMTTTQISQVVTNLLSTLCLQQQQQQQQQQGVALPPAVQQQASILEALANQANVSPVSLPTHGVPPGMPSGLAPMHPGQPLGYFPVVPGGLPPGMGLVPEGAPGFCSSNPIGALSSAQGIPYSGVSNMIMPDLITSANGVLNLAANGSNINDLIQTVLSLQTQGHAPMVGPQYAGGSEYGGPVQGNGVPAHVVMNGGMAYGGPAGFHVANGVQKGGLVSKHGMGRNSVDIGALESDGTSGAKGVGENNIHANGALKSNQQSHSVGMDTGLSQSVPNGTAFAAAEGGVRSMSGIV